MTKRTRLRRALLMHTGCTIQHTGWPCNSCFHALDLNVADRTLHAFWQAVLAVRGDYDDNRRPTGYRMCCGFRPPTKREAATGQTLGHTYRLIPFAVIERRVDQLLRRLEA